MIDRYTTPEMEKIWSEENKFETWKMVEIAVTEVLTEKPLSLLNNTSMHLNL